MKYEFMFDLAMGIAQDKQEDTQTERTFRVKGKDVKLDFKAQQKLLRKQVQAFMHMPAVKVNDTKAMQAFAGSSDLPVLTKDVFNVFSFTQDWDLGWQRAYKGIKLGPSDLSWDIATVESGISFKLIPEGGRIAYGDIAGEKVIAEVEKYGAGLGVTWEILNGKKLYRFVQIMEDARAALYDLWANIHYGLIAAASLSDTIAWQGIVTDREIDRDIATLSKGADDCGAANKNKGYGNMANARFLIYAQPTLRSRINQALAATRNSTVISTGKGQVVESNISPIYTYNASVLANKGLLVLPGNKIQNAVKISEKSFEREDIESLNKLQTYWTAFGATIADTDQVFELSFS